MARGKRILKKDASYHVIAIFNRFENAFELDLFKEMFLVVLMQAKENYSFLLFHMLQS